MSLGKLSLGSTSVYIWSSWTHFSVAFDVYDWNCESKWAVLFVRKGLLRVLSRGGDCCDSCILNVVAVPLSPNRLFTSLQVGCACSQERGGKDALSIFYPRRSAEVSWQMAEDRLTGEWGGNHVEKSSLDDLESTHNLLGSAWCDSEKVKNLQCWTIFLHLAPTWNYETTCYASVATPLVPFLSYNLKVHVLFKILPVLHHVWAIYFLLAMS